MAIDGALQAEAGTALGARPSAGGGRVLEANLAALAVRSPATAERVRVAAPHPGVRWTKTDQEGAWSAELDGRLLASRRRPLDEAKALADTVDYRAASGIVVLGFGLGYHVWELARRGGQRTALIVFEPDAALLRAVLEHADLSALLREHLVFVFTDADDTASIDQSLHGLEGMLGLGISVVEHMPSRARLGESAGRFAASVTRYISSLRTQVITTMMNMQTTLRNLLMNLDEYAQGAGIAELEGAARGRAAIVVSAGPSLARNIALLEDQCVREGFVIIAVQTVLKQLLARGIRPHFVTALDFHEISARFYEGLSAQDVEGVTLVAEPKANPAILQAFPGSVRLTRSDVLDWLLGDELAREHGETPPGATVAHLAYLLARHLGCEPVVLMGQDLAFTDGQYYAHGAAIHDVWSTELNPFNTLEMMEWQRIVRWRGHLHTVRDHLDRPVYTDDQMSAYLGQFERLFLTDAQRGLLTIDASEGGARKAHTRAMTLRDALEEFGPRDGLAGAPEFSQPPRAGAPSAELVARVETVRQGVRDVARACREAEGLLTTMQEHHADQARVNTLIERVHEVQSRVKALEPAYGLVQRLNQAGAFKRFRADRDLSLDEGASALERQKKQIERDRMNVTWLGDAADALDELLGATLTMLSGGPRQSRDPAGPVQGVAAASAGKAASGARLGAIMVAGASGDTTFMGAPAADLTRARLAGIAGIDELQTIARPPSLEDPGKRAARAWARWCWRGGLGGQSIYDEILDPAALARAMEEMRIDAALIVGADWAMVDVDLCAAVIARHRENPAEIPLAFTQAPPGLCGVVISRRLCEDLASGQAKGAPGASIGGLLAFNPFKPALDPVAKPCCVQIDHAVRSSPWRYVPDGVEGLWLERAMANPDARRASAAQIVARARAFAREHGVGPPRHLVLELAGDARGALMDGELAARALFELAAMGPGEAVTFSGALTLTGARDPVDHPHLTRLIALARSLGLFVHVRTSAAYDEGAAMALLGAGPDVVSVDLVAVERTTYAALTGGGDMDLALRTTERMLSARRLRHGLPHPWIVPRITRRDAVYAEIEGFFDRGVVFGGACVIDPLPRAIEGERIAPFAKPAGATVRDALTRMMIRADGSAPMDELDWSGSGASSRAVDASIGTLGDAWGRVVARRLESLRLHGAGHADLRTGA